ncbi:MAG: sodium:proton antiporter [Alphaproteobacteria bacterium]|nr:sodium:proton antiporter [Alphaproteobacteria bacterium]
MESSLLNLAAILLTLAATFGYINHRWFKMPHTIGLVVIALLVSFGVIIIELTAPSLGFQNFVGNTIASVNFPKVVMMGMLSFLLFSGALHTNLEQLNQKKIAIGTMATIGVLTSTLLIGYTTYYVCILLGLSIPLSYCFVFGALISPTDPIAVLSILKNAKIPESLKAKISGESLFNDGVGIVIFTIMVAVAFGNDNINTLSIGGISKLFLLEALGGVLLGLATGIVAYIAIKSIDEHNLEVLITLALVTITYSIAIAIHISGPIAVVVSGLLIGNQGKNFAMSKSTRDHLFKFWSLTDEVLNSILFLLIGLQVITITFSSSISLAMVAAIPIALVARFLSVAIPIKFLSNVKEFTKGAIPILTWGGLRGGISVALALSLPSVPGKDLILAMTYGVVIFSIIVQGLTMSSIIKRFIK